MTTRKILAVAAVAAAFSASAETRIGIIGIDTSHTIAFTQIINGGKEPWAEGFRVTAAPERGSWRQWGRMPLAYAAARGRVDLALRRQGWEKRKTVDFDRVQWKTLELWTRGEERILVQYWRIEVALTGVAWGNLTEEKNHERQNHI